MVAIVSRVHADGRLDAFLPALGVHRHAGEIGGREGAVIAEIPGAQSRERPDRDPPVEPRVGARPGILIDRLDYVIRLADYLPDPEPDHDLDVGQMPDDLTPRPLARPEPAAEPLLAHPLNERSDPFRRPLEDLKWRVLPQQPQYPFPIFVHASSYHTPW